MRRRSAPSAVQQPVSENPSPAGQVISGRLVGMGSEAEVEVHVAVGGVKQTLRARVAVRLEPTDLGREVMVCLSQEEGRPAVVIGLLQTAAELAPSRLAPTLGGAIEARLDGERVVLSAEREIELRCGKSSITLRADGKLVIKGEHVVSSASGPHRIRGGSVQIN